MDGSQTGFDRRVNRRDFLRIAGLTVAGLAASCLPQEAIPSVISADRLKEIRNPAERPVLLGMAANDAAWIPSEKGFDRLETLGIKPAIRHFYQDWSENPDASEFQTEAMKNIRSLGSIPMITWMPELAGKGAFEQPEFGLATIANGQHDKHIKAWAIKAKEFGEPFFLRFAHEMNGGWYPWGTGKHWQTGDIPNHNSPGQFVAAWRHCFEVFKSVGAENATWVWCPDTAGDIGQVPRLYPGDGYVHWTAMDGYNWGNTYGGHKINFTDIFEPLYKIVTKIAPKKPIMLAEFGVAHDYPDRAGWLKDAFNNQIPNHFPQIQAAVYFDRDKPDEGNNWLLEGDAAAEQVLREMAKNQFYLQNQFDNLPAEPVSFPKNILSSH